MGPYEFPFAFLPSSKSHFVVDFRMYMRISIYQRRIGADFIYLRSRRSYLGHRTRSARNRFALGARVLDFVADSLLF